MPCRTITANFSLSLDKVGKQLLDGRRQCMGRRRTYGRNQCGR